jgi:hypothetical protein
MHATGSLNKLTIAFPNGQMKTLGQHAASRSRYDGLHRSVARRGKEPAKRDTHRCVAELELRPSDEHTAAKDLESMHGVSDG